MAANCDGVCCVCNAPYRLSDRRQQLISCKSSGCKVKVHRECSGIGIERYDFVRMAKEFALNHQHFNFTCPKCRMPSDQELHQEEMSALTQPTQPTRPTRRGRGSS